MPEQILRAKDDLGTARDLAQLRSDGTYGLRTETEITDVQYDAIIAELQGIKGYVDTLETSFTSLISEVDALEESIGSTTDLDTAQTVIGRLKQILTTFNSENFAQETTLESLRANFATFRTNIEARDLATGAKQDSQVTALNTIIGHVDVLDTIASYLDDVEARLNTLIAEVDGLEEVLGSTSDADSAQTIVGRLKKLVNLFDAENFASETTLAAFKANFDSYKATFESRDIATSAKQDSHTTLLTSIRDYLDTVETKLQTLINIQGGGSSEATLSEFKLESHNDLEAIKAEIDLLEESIGAITDSDAASTVIGRLKRLVSILDNVDFATSTKQDSEINQLTIIAAHLDTVEEKLQSLIDAQGTSSTLSYRMMQKNPQDGYNLWFDTADSNHIYIAEAPAAADPAIHNTWRGIRITLVSGNPLGEVQTLVNFNWNNRTAGGWS